jgi:hypothetical protein
MQTGMSFMAKGLTHVHTPPSDESRYSFWLAFGFTPDEQRAYEGKFTNFSIDYTKIVPADYNTITHFEL